MTEDDKADLEALVSIPKPPEEFSLDRFRVKPVVTTVGVKTPPEDYDPPSYGLDHPSPCPDIRGLTHDAVVEAMVEWFFTNFEDPAESTPHDEGENVFIWGGPYDAREELENAFGDKVTERTIKEAVDRVEDEGWEWAPSSSRIVPENEINNWRVEIRYLGKAEPTVVMLNKLGGLDALVESDPDWLSIEGITIKSLNAVWPVGSRPLSPLCVG